MFPEYRDQISKLKTADAHFAKLFHAHNELDQRIKNIEGGVESADTPTVEVLKKEKLRLKDEIYGILQKSAAA